MSGVRGLAKAATARWILGLLLLTAVGAEVAPGTRLALAAAPAAFRAAVSSGRVLLSFAGAPSTTYTVYRSTGASAFSALSTYTTGGDGVTGEAVPGWTEDPSTKEVSYLDLSPQDFYNYYYYVVNESDSPPSRSYTLSAFFSAEPVGPRELRSRHGPLRPLP